MGPKYFDGIVATFLYPGAVFVFVLLVSIHLEDVSNLFINVEKRIIVNEVPMPQFQPST